jgi:hypothetical protein
MKKIEEQLESIEEVLSLVIRKNASIENLIQIAADSQNKALSETLIEIKRDLKQNPSSQYLESYFSEVKRAIVNIQKTTEVRNHHHFDLRSKGFIISVIALLITTSISIAVAFSSYRESRRLAGNDVKYRMIRQINPALVAWADSTFYNNPDSALTETKRREDFELVVKDAEANFNKKKEEAENARKLLKSLEKK